MGYNKLNVRWTTANFGLEYAVDDNIIRVEPSPTPSPTPTPSPSPSSTPASTPTPTPSFVGYFYDAQDCNDPFASPVVVKHNTILVIGSAVKVVGDANTCYEVLNASFSSVEDFVVDSVYTDCVDCSLTITPTPTPTNSPTPSITPSITPTLTPSPSPVYYFYEAVNCNDLFGPTYILRATIQYFIGDVVSVFGDPVNCYEIIGLSAGPTFNFEINTGYADCGSCIPGP